MIRGETSGSVHICRIQFSREQVVAFGDGVNDLAMMAEAGVSIAYHAKPVVREKRLTVSITWGWMGC
jgi:phosphoserine phosphatase